ncbi:hypothetical protein KCU93_g304, partial [Aureobasidium melanogenum]
MTSTPRSSSFLFVPLAAAAERAPPAPCRTMANRSQDTKIGQKTRQLRAKRATKKALAPRFVQRAGRLAVARMSISSDDGIAASEAPERPKKVIRGTSHLLDKFRCGSFSPLVQPANAKPLRIRRRSNHKGCLVSILSALFGTIYEKRCSVWNEFPSFPALTAAQGDISRAENTRVWRHDTVDSNCDCVAGVNEMSETRKLNANRYKVIIGLKLEAEISAKMRLKCRT